MPTDDVPTKAMPVRPIAIADATAIAEPPIQVDDRPLVTDVARYEMLGTIGKGGMGEIRLARDSRIARQVAIKVLRPQIRDQRDYRSRFLVEARLQGQLEHPSIVPVHDLGETPEGELFFSMKCVRGVTLREALEAVKRGERTPRFTQRRLLAAFSSVCLAVDFAHTRGVVHRDLKPANVMFGDFGEVYVLDWGIAKLVDDPDTPVEHAIEVPGSGDAETHAGTVLGTPEYMAPERRLRGVADRRTDIYALGVILREMLAADRTREVPPELAAIVAAATDEDAARRQTSVRELHDLIEAYLDGDRDLELRRKQAEDHARAAEQALASGDPTARTDAGHAIGRALGLDPSNERAMRTLMRLLTDIPARMPPGAQAEIDRVWQVRRRRTLQLGTLIAAAVLLYAPFILWMGVRNWTLFALWLGLATAAVVGQFIASRNERTLPFVIAVACALGELAVLTSSMGVTGFVPAAFAVVAIAWRMTVRRWFHGVLILAGLVAAICTPFLLPALGLMTDAYRLQGDTMVVFSHMHHLPPTAAAVSLILTVVGAITGALLFGRVYAGEIRRAEERLTFHAWQLQQLLR